MESAISLLKPDERRNFLQEFLFKAIVSQIPEREKIRVKGRIMEIKSEQKGLKIIPRQFVTLSKPMVPIPPATMSSKPRIPPLALPSENPLISPKISPLPLLLTQTIPFTPPSIPSLISPRITQEITAGITPSQTISKEAALEPSSSIISQVNEANLDKLNLLLRNPSVRVIKCDNTAVKIKISEEFEDTDIALSEEEKREVIKRLANQIRMPVTDIFKAKIGNFNVNAINSPGRISFLFARV